MGYKMEIPVGMLFRKMYCRYCGERLKKHKIVDVYTVGDPNFSRTMKIGPAGHKIVNIHSQTLVTYIYKCPNCNKPSTYKEQLEYSKIQKRLGKKILSDDEIKK
ncbi:MAG: hypothetical protein IJ004_03790 [Clostridia bacterium]|nr:hypothetical protein [Clostridia bacterium]